MIYKAISLSLVSYISRFSYIFFFNFSSNVIARNKEFKKVKKYLEREVIAKIYVELKFRKFNTSLPC